MLCKVCGAQIPDDASVCEFCGAEISEENISKGVDDETRVIPTGEVESRLENDTEKETAELEQNGDEIFDDNERRRRKQMEKMLEDKKQQLSEIERRRNKKRQKQKRNKIILIALICALAVAAVGIGVYYVTQNVNESRQVDETPIPTVSTSATAFPTAEPTVEPSPSLSMTPSPNEDADGTNGEQTPSWTATGRGGSSSGGSVSGGSYSGSSGTSSSNSGSGSSSNSGSGNSGASSSGSASSGASNSTPVSISNSGVSTSNISSKLSTGEEVIYNTGTGRLLMTFVTDNVRYYANVSEGSTTDQVKNKPYTITAVPTNETYNGNTVYEITVFTKYDGVDYILANSGTTLLTADDIKGMSKYDLALARNEIYARHGRKFQTAEYSNYFSSKSWYQLNPSYNYSDDNSNLNDIEIKNVQFILKAERR